MFRAKRYSSQLKSGNNPDARQPMNRKIKWPYDGILSGNQNVWCVHMIQHGWPLEVSHGRLHCPLYEMSKINESIETESRSDLAKKAEEEEWEWTMNLFTARGLLPSGGWTCSEIRCTVLWIYKTLLSWHFKMVNFMRCVELHLNF